MRHGGPLAHRVEQGTFNPKVAGSRPARPTHITDASAIAARTMFDRARMWSEVHQPVAESIQQVTVGLLGTMLMLASWTLFGS